MILKSLSEILIRWFTLETASMRAFVARSISDGAKISIKAWDLFSREENPKRKQPKFLAKSHIIRKSNVKVTGPRKR